MNYADKIKNSLNKNKTICDVVNLETNTLVILRRLTH